MMTFLDHNCMCSFCLSYFSFIHLLSYHALFAFLALLSFCHVSILVFLLFFLVVFIGFVGKIEGVVDTFSWLCCDPFWNMAVKCGILMGGRPKHQSPYYLHACKYILGCSVTTWDEPVRADLGWKTLKNRKDYHKSKWYFKITYMNIKRLSFKVLTNEWDKVKCKGSRRKSWLAQVDF